jgi:hypothetical protein
VDRRSPHESRELLAELTFTGRAGAHPSLKSCKSCGVSAAIPLGDRIRGSGAGYSPSALRSMKRWPLSTICGMPHNEHVG